MMKLSCLDVGDRFRIAQSSETSMNGRVMSQEMVFKVVKVYEQEPRVRICADCGGSDGIYSLMPGVVAIYPSEPRPSPREIDSFLGLPRKTIPVGYEILWDGTSDISHLVPRSCLNVLRVWLAFGERVMSPGSLSSVMDENYYTVIKKMADHKYQPSVVLKKYLRTLVTVGLVTEITDQRSLESRTREVYGKSSR